METLLNWDVAERPVFSNNIKINGYKAIFRDDNDICLNVSKESYTPVTNSKFIEIVSQMSEITGYPIKCYDEFQKGKKILAFLECTEPVTVLGYTFDDYMLIGNSHDSSTGFFIGNSNQMIRCQNRFSRKFRQIEVRHTRNNAIKIESLLQEFKTFKNERQHLYETFEKWGGIKVDEGLKNMLVERLVDMKKEERLDPSLISTRKANIIQSMNISIQKEMLDLGQNMFGLFNGITHYTTHARNNKEDIFCNAMGGANDINQIAYKFCEYFVTN